MSTSKTHLIQTACLVFLLGSALDLRAGDADVTDALLHAITLEGHSCGEVLEDERQAIADYLVTCSDGSRYQVRITPHGQLEVTDLADPSTAAPTDHAAIVKRSLTAVIHLADAACGGVVHVVTQSPRDHLATCTNQRRYRVYVDLDGRVAVVEQ